MPEDELLRTADAERDKVIAALSDHYALGRLSLDELNDRVGQVLQARTRAQLVAPLSDLPAEPVTPSRPARRPSVAPVPGSPAKARWTPWLATAVICLTIWLVTSVAHGSALYFWPAWVIGPWAAAMAAGSFACPLGRRGWASVPPRR